MASDPERSRTNQADDRVTVNASHPFSGANREFVRLERRTGYACPLRNFVRERSNCSR